MDLVEISNSLNQHVTFFWIDLYANTPPNYEIKTAISYINQRDEDHFKFAICKFIKNYYIFLELLFRGIFLELVSNHCTKCTEEI